MESLKSVLLYSPAASSLNMGDHIIVEGVKTQLKELLEESFIVEISTHLPISRYLRHTDDFDYKFVCGSNLLRGKMNRFFRQWDINIFNAKFVGPSILVGVGWWQYGDEPNFYTKKLYKKVLSPSYLHSVRDSYTENQLKKIGITNVINTACPSMWGLTEAHCKDIPRRKAKDVVCTITDYKSDIERDSKFFKILLENYENVYFWVQGTQDFNYFNQLNIDKDRIIIIPPHLDSFDDILSRDIDYVGTRLHAGIRALQKKKRTIIIAVDNRAKEKQRDFNLKCIERELIDDLAHMINSDFSTDIIIPIDNIKKWKSQFIK